MGGDPVNTILVAIIAIVAIAGPTILALALFWRRNPDRRLSWRRALDASSDADREHFRGPSWQGPFIGGGGGGGDGGGGDSSS
jgi:hypothetical protein